MWLTGGWELGTSWIGTNHDEIGSHNGTTRRSGAA
jgi:hypothetical protein